VAQRVLERPCHAARCGQDGGVKLAIEIVILLFVVVPTIVAFAVFVWAAKKDGEADRAVQKRLGIRRRSRMGP
jgi:uncharacterized membrane protein